MSRPEITNYVKNSSFPIVLLRMKFSQSMVSGSDQRTRLTGSFPKPCFGSTAFLDSDSLGPYLHVCEIFSLFMFLSALIDMSGVCARSCVRAFSSALAGVFWNLSVLVNSVLSLVSAQMLHRDAVHGHS